MAPSEWGARRHTPLDRRAAGRARAGLVPRALGSARRSTSTGSSSLPGAVASSVSIIWPFWCALPVCSACHLAARWLCSYQCSVNGFDAAVNATHRAVDAATCMSAALGLRTKLNHMVAYRAVMAVLCSVVVSLLFLLPKFDKYRNKVSSWR